MGPTGFFYRICRLNLPLEIMNLLFRFRYWKNYWDDIRFQLTPPELGSLSFKIPISPAAEHFPLAPHSHRVSDFPPYSLYQEIAIEFPPTAGAPFFREVCGFLPQKARYLHRRNY